MRRDPEVEALRERIAELEAEAERVVAWFLAHGTYRDARVLPPSLRAALAADRDDNDGH